MSNSTRIKRLFLAAAGFSLLLSPFVMLSQASTSAGTSALVVLVSMSIGFQALVTAVLNSQHYCWVRGALGMALGIAILGGTSALGDAEQYTVALSASIAGVTIISIAVAECFGNNQNGRSQAGEGREIALYSLRYWHRLGEPRKAPETILAFRSSCQRSGKPTKSIHPVTISG
ncbi:hypothetical protein RUE5091_00257 [Ruegeria denitrificans]|uniref:Uncharacterized protein n=1 Tax=Ruegeria denitrificans TaxID=1715692 RepID=A0A0N7M882_9RHOB|nr:hypothetical protein [Ruegeria denitrificans]CUJ84760.1 hypothetical protein RUE5091_00257 [Ruegeria denitrificans]